MLSLLFNPTLKTLGAKALPTHQTDIHPGFILQFRILTLNLRSSRACFEALTILARPADWFAASQMLDIQQRD